MSEGKIIQDLTQGNPLKQLLKFSFPFILANLLQQAYNIADLIIVGQMIGSVGLAAVSSGGEITMMFLFGAIGFSSGGQILIAQHIGADCRERVGKAIGTLFTSLLIMAIGFMVIAFLICDGALRLMNVPEAAMEYAHEYSIVFFFGMIPVFGYNAVSAILRGMGDSKHPFLFVGIAAVLNVGLDLLFVGPFGMETMGAALATVISQTVSFLISLVFLYRHRAEFGFDFHLSSFRIAKSELNGIVKMGLPLCLMNISVSISMMFINRYINAYGVAAAAATAVGNKISMVATICTGAMTAAGSSIVAQNFAARKFERLTKVLGYILLVSLAFTALLALILILFPEQVFGVFDKDPEVLELSHQYMLSGAIALLGFATRGTGYAFCNGIGNSRMTFWGGILDGIVVRIGLSLLFGKALGMGISGFWLGSAIAGHAIGVVSVIYYCCANWKDRKLLA